MVLQAETSWCELLESKIIRCRNLHGGSVLRRPKRNYRPGELESGLAAAIDRTRRVLLHGE
jgi:hypothetical protein